MLLRKLAVICGLLLAVPAFANNTRISPSQFAASQPPPVLRLMNDAEFATFLQHLDAELLRAQSRIKKMDMKALSLDAQETQDLVNSHERCLESLDNTRDEVQKLAQNQTLKLDLFLLIDLNQLARNLDLLDESLVNPAAVNGVSGAQKSLSYAREILGIDGSLASQISVFQHHFIAFTGVVDATLDAADAEPPQAPTDK
jgi:hypothetical protein